MKKIIIKILNTVAIGLVLQLNLFAQRAEFIADTVCAGRETTFKNVSDPGKYNPAYYRWSWGKYISGNNVTWKEFYLHTTSDGMTFKKMIPRDWMINGRALIKLEVLPSNSAKDDTANISYVEFFPTPDIGINVFRNGVRTDVAKMCEGESLQLIAYAVNDNIDNPSYYNKFWNTDDIYTKQVTVTKPMEYVITVLKKYDEINYCAAQQSVEVSYFKKPTVTISSTATSVRMGESVTLTASGANSYVWSPAGIPNISNPTITPGESTKYSVIGTDVNGCSSSTSSIDITVTLPFKTIKDAKNFLTPGRGYNNIWVLANEPMYDNCEFIIYNAWGQAIYKKDGVRGGWNGTTDKGDEAPEGTYYYLIRDKSNSDNTYTGYITLLR